MRFVIAVNGGNEEDFDRICQWFLDHFSDDQRPDVSVVISYDSGDKSMEALIWDAKRLFGDRLRHLEVVPKAPWREA